MHTLRILQPLSLLTSFWTTSHACCMFVRHVVHLYSLSTARCAKYNQGRVSTTFLRILVSAEAGACKICIDTSNVMSLGFAKKEKKKHGTKVRRVQRKRKTRKTRAALVVSPCDATRNNSLEVDDVSRVERETPSPRSIIRR